MLAEALALAAFIADPPPDRCQWIKGRLTVGNGTPHVRIWPRGTRRLLGVTTRSGGAEAPDVMPANVRSFLRHNRTDRIWGQFRICPIEADRSGRMRTVVLARARYLSRAD